MQQFAAGDIFGFFGWVHLVRIIVTAFVTIAIPECFFTYLNVNAVVPQLDDSSRPGRFNEMETNCKISGIAADVLLNQIRSNKLRGGDWVSFLNQFIDFFHPDRFKNGLQFLQVKHT